MSLKVAAGVLVLTAPFAALGSLTVLGGNQPAAAQTTTVGNLNTTSVPHGWASWVEAAGSLCAEISPPIIAAQIQTESSWNPRAVSPAGAEGLSQFLPSTWAHIGQDDDGSGVASPYDPGDAIMAQGRYDCEIVQQVRAAGISGDLTKLALAGYNAGPGAVITSRGIPAIPETTAYVASILSLASKYTSTSTTTTNAATGAVAAVIAIAESKLGTPYAYGGGGPYGPGAGWYGGTVGWDCSSFMQYIFWQGSHVLLPRTAAEQATAGTAVAQAAIEPGDIVVFGSPGHHVGIYIGDGKMINEPHTGASARVEQLIGSSYWNSEKPWTIRRIL